MASVTSADFRGRMFQGCGGVETCSLRSTLGVVQVGPANLAPRCYVRIAEMQDWLFGFRAAPGAHGL
jgi:hypothetical protein